MFPANFRLSTIKPCFYWKYKEDFKWTFKISRNKSKFGAFPHYWFGVNKPGCKVADRQKVGVYAGWRPEKNKWHKIVSGLVKDFSKNFIYLFSILFYHMINRCGFEGLPTKFMSSQYFFFLLINCDSISVDSVNLVFDIDMVLKGYI